MFYSSINNDFIKNIKKLNEKKYRDKKHLFIVEGEHLVKEAIKKGKVCYILVENGYNFNYDGKIIKVTNKVLKYISNLENPPKIMAVCNKVESKTINKKILVLDNIQDPGNLGTIIRSCVAFNVETLVLSKNCVDAYNSKVIRASQGMIFNINIIIADIYSFLLDLKKNGYLIIGTDVKCGISIDSLKTKEKFAIIMGNEGTGISSIIKNICEKFIYIPMNDLCESLNVGVATSIILYELR